MCESRREKQAQREKTEILKNVLGVVKGWRGSHCYSTMIIFSSLFLSSFYSFSGPHPPTPFPGWIKEWKIMQFKAQRRGNELRIKFCDLYSPASPSRSFYVGLKLLLKHRNNKNIFLFYVSSFWDVGRKLWKNIFLLFWISTKIIKT